jgi:hypothetical protein
MRTTKELAATEGSTVPQVQFLSSWTARDRRLFATFRKIVRITSAKRFGPGFPARAKSAFHLKDPLIRFEPRRIKSLKIFDDSRAIDPVTGLATHPP